MQLSRALSTLGHNDTRLVGRDSFLAGMFGFLIVVSTALRFALPWLDGVVAASGLPFVLSDYDPLIFGFIVLAQVQTLAGLIVGFLILDERDQHTLTALQVTPLPMRYYLAYRVLVPTLLGFLAVLIAGLIIGRGAPPLWQLVALAAGAAPYAAIIALFLASFAENKVQGFALNKILGLVGALLVAAWFTPEPFQYLFGVLPPFWVLKAYWTAVEGGAHWPLFVLVGLLLSAGLILYLVRRFERAALAAG